MQQLKSWKTLENNCTGRNNDFLRRGCDKIELILFVISAILLVIFIVILSNIDQKKLDLELAKSKILRLEDEILTLNSELIFYKNQVYNRSSVDNTIINNDIKEAVKYAMKKSHPDNNGNAEDFDKFRKLYEKIK